MRQKTLSLHNKSDNRFPSVFFAKNREKLFQKIPDQSLVVIVSNPSLYHNGDNAIKFKQNSNLYYLCGITQEKSKIVLLKQSKDLYYSYLFLNTGSEKSTIWDGQKINKKEATEICEIKNILDEQHFEDNLRQWTEVSKKIFFCIEQRLPKETKEDPNKELLLKLKKNYPLKEYENISPILAQMREIKQTEEIMATKKAIDIMAQAFKNVAQFLKKKRKKAFREYELEAILAQSIISQGSSFAFCPIVGAGKNACILHYIKNNDNVHFEDSVLIDAGAEYAEYNSDITRVFPTAKTFSKRQKEVYLAVDNIRKKAIALLDHHFSTKKEWLIKEYQKKVNEFTKEEIIKLGLAKASDDKKELAQSVKKYMPHGISHSLGLEVHDVENLYDKERKWKSGMIITVEPGIYIKDEGIGIRLEDNILLQENGVEILSKKIPTDLDEIQDLIN